MPSKKYDFFISHTTAGLGRLLAVEIQSILAVLGYSAFVDQLDNVLSRDTTHLTNAIGNSANFICVANNEFIQRLNGTALQKNTKENWIAFEMHEILERVTSSEGFLIALGFEGQNDFEFSNKFLGSEFFQHPDAKEWSDIGTRRNAIFKSYPVEQSLSEAMPSFLERILRHPRVVASIQNRDDGVRAVNEIARTVFYSDSILSSLHDVGDALDAIEADLCAEDGNKTISLDQYLSRDPAGLDILPHKYYYLTSVGSRLYTDEIEKSQEQEEKILNDQGQSFLSAVTQKISDDYYFYMSNGLLQRGKNRVYDDLHEELPKSESILVDLLVNLVNGTQNGFVNLIVLGSGTGEREASLVKSFFGAVFENIRDVSNDAFDDLGTFHESAFGKYITNAAGRIRIFCVDISSFLLVKSASNFSHKFSFASEPDPSGLRVRLVEFLQNIDIRYLGISFKDLGNIRGVIKAKRSSRNLYLLLGNTFGVQSSEEQLEFVQSINDLAGAGDWLVVEIDTKVHSNLKKLCAEKTVAAERGGIVNGAFGLFNSIREFMAYNSPLNKNYEYVKRASFSNNSNYELLYLETRNGKTFFPVAINEIFALGTDTDAATNEIRSIRKQLEPIGLDDNWSLEGCITANEFNSVNSSSTVTPALAILRRMPTALS